MAGICVEKIVHDDPKCGAHALQVFMAEDGTYNGFCFSCGRYEHDPYKDKPKDYKPVAIRKTQEQIDNELAEIHDYQTVALPERKLRKESLEYFGIKIGVSEADGATPVSHYYPYYLDGVLVGYKARVIENKQMWRIGDCKDVDLFGWNEAVAAGGKTLYITEGECDAVALYQIFKDKARGSQYADLNPAVVSVPHGAAAAAKDLTKLKAKIDRVFKEVVFVFDTDKAGEEAVEKCMVVFPNAKSAVLPGKDVNDCLIKGKGIAAFNAIRFNATKPKNTRLVSVASVVEAARKPAEWGFSYPYQKLTEITRGQRLGEVTYWGAGVKMGKSELLNDLVAHNITEHGWSCFVAKTEESNARTLQGVAGKIVNKIFHDPKIEFDFAAFDKAVAVIDERLLMLNLYQELGWEILKDDIKSAVAEGAKAIYVDPITTFTNGVNAADANTMLQKICQELASMAADLGFAANLFCHLKSPDVGLPHERGGQVQSYQFAGSRAMMRSAHCMIGMEGNKDPDLPELERNLRTLVVLENRYTGQTGKIPLYYDGATGAFNELRN
jgi:twinkle protein